MRKTIFTLGLMLAAALSLTNCTKNEEANFTPEVKTPFELYANLESRTTNDGMRTEWADGDQINVFHAVAGTSEYVHDTPYDEVAKVGNPFVTDATGLFKGTLAGELDQTKSYDWYAFYPYNSYIKTPANVSRGYTAIGSSHDGTQIQTGNDSMAHIAGDNYPLYGVAKGVAASAKPSITMSHASSLVEFVVKNGTGEAFVVKSIAFTAPEDIVGTYYINFASEPVVYTKSGDDYVSSTATLSVDGGTDVPADGAYFYMGIKPFTAAASSELTVNIETDKGTFAKTITLANATTFSAGLIKTLTVTVNELVVPDEPEGETATGTIDFRSTAQRTSFSTTAQVWSNAGITLTNSKDSSATNVADYSNPARFYKSSSITISAPSNITKLYFECDGAEYATALKNSIGSAASVSGSNVTVVLDGTSDTFTATLSEGKVFVNSLTVTYISTGQEIQTLSFDSTAVEATLGQPFTAPTLTGAKTAVTYTSSNTGVATVDENTGEVTLKVAGETKITATAEGTEDYFSATASYTLTVIDPNATVDYTTENTSNVTLSTTGGTSASTAKVKVDGHEYVAIKLGANKTAGAWKVTVPAGKTKLHLHLAGWNKENVVVSVSGATVDKSSLSLISDSGISGNSPFTLSTSDSSSFYHELTLSNVTEATTLTFKATSGKRFVVWGVNAE